MGSCRVGELYYFRAGTAMVLAECEFSVVDCYERRVAERFTIRTPPCLRMPYRVTDFYSQS
jgi:hypothetical protein